MNLTLILEIDYDLNGEKAETIKSMLDGLVMRGIDDGLLTGDSNATVRQYSYRIERLTVKNSKKKVTTQQDVQTRPVVGPRVSKKQLRDIERRIEAAEARLGKSKAPTFSKFWASIAEYFEDAAGDKDFSYDAHEAGDNTPHFENGAWINYADALEFGRTDGIAWLRQITYDGNDWDDGYEVDEKDSNKTFAEWYRETQQLDRHFIQWAKYHLWCAEQGSGTDPLDEFTGWTINSSPTAAGHVKAALDNLSYVEKGGKR